MGVQILERSTKYYNQFKNIDDFSANPLDFTNNFTGSVMENIKLVKQIEVSWFSKTKDTASTWTVDSGAGTLFSTGGDFIGDGFAVGDTFIYQELSGGSPAQMTGQITAISTTTIIFTVLTGSRVNLGETDAMIRGTTDLTAMNYRFGLIETADSFSIESKVSNNDQGYYGSDIGFDIGGGVRDTNFVTFQKLAQYADWQTGSLKIRFVSDDYDPSSARVGSQLFEIEHEFSIVPYYLDGEITNLQNNVIPNLFAGQNTIKYVYSPGFSAVISNPNTEKSIEIDSELGSVAWYGENFNGFNNNYEIISVNYEEEATGNPSDGLIITSKTKVTINVRCNTRNFVVGERSGVYISYLPEQIEYTNTVLTDLKENFLYDNSISSEGQPPVSGLEGIISDYEITNLSGNTMTLTFNVEYSLAQKLRIASLHSQSPRSFLVAVQLGDVTIDSGNSDRVMILASVEEYDESADVPGLWSFTKFDIYSHEKQIGVTTGTTDVVAWNEDGVVVDYTMELDLTKDAVLNSLDFLLVAFNPITSSYFEIDKYSYNIFPGVTSSGIQQLILNTTRGYILESNDQFNKVEISVGSNIAGIQQYNGVIAQKFSWQDWIENLNVDTVFFDAAKPHNNLNDKTSNYSFLNGYEIRLAFFGNLFGTNSLGVSGLTNYLITSPPLTVFDYEKDGNVTPIWSCVIETFDASGTTNLGGSILSGQDTLFRSTWTNTGGPVTDLTTIYGINRIELTNQPGYAITEMSSLNDPDSGQLLKPTGILTLLDLQIVGNDLVMECLIDGNLVSSGSDYNISSRVHDSNTGIIEGKITEQGVLKITEQSVQKIVE